MDKLFMTVVSTFLVIMSIQQCSILFKLNGLKDAIRSVRDKLDYERDRTDSNVDMIVCQMHAIADRINILVKPIEDQITGAIKKLCRSVDKED